MKNKKEIPIKDKLNLTIEEAALYSNIGTKRLREITDDPLCNFVIFVGYSEKKKLIKRKQFEEWIYKQKYI